MFKAIGSSPLISRIAPRLESRRARTLAPFAAALVVVLMAGCTFLQPDFSAGVVDEPAPASTPVTTEVRSVVTEAQPAVQESRAQAQSDAPPAEVVSQRSPEIAEAEAGQEPASTTDVAEGGAGPLNDILGDNAATVKPPSGPGLGAAPQLSGLTPLEIVAAQDQVLAGIYDSLLPSVVLVKVSRNLGSIGQLPSDAPNPNAPDDFFERTGGTGFVWDDEGHIVTNHHVVTEADRIVVMLPNRVEMVAELVGSDPDSDLAVLRVSDPDGFLQSVTLGDSDQVYMGQLAAAIGNPFGQEFSITTGIISAMGRTIRSGFSQFSIPEVLQTDAPINPGNSGGPLLDRNGHVIGVNTQIISRAGINSGIGFAVPINIAKQVVPSLISDGEYSYSWLGISGTTLAPDTAEAMDLPRKTRGALVIDVVNGGPADDGGMAGSDDSMEMEGITLPIGGDVIVAINGEAIETIGDVIAILVGKTQPNQEVTFDIIRNGETQQLTVTLGTRPGQ